MAERGRSTTISDLNHDSLVHCASFLHSLKDLSNLAMSCKFLKSVAYSDNLWRPIFRNSWPNLGSALSQFSGVRDTYVARRTALLQFKFQDPFIANINLDATTCSHIIMNKDDLILSKGSWIQVLKTSSLSNEGLTLRDHNAKITCMRLFPLRETSLYRSSTDENESALVTSSRDRSIRLWWKGSSQRCFRGHSGPVLSLSDKLLGDGSTKAFASGGDDHTVRLWSLSSSGKRGQRGLQATLYGHERPVEFLSVAGHNANLLATISRDSKIRLWDTAVTSTLRSSCFVGMASVPGKPVGLKCHESMLYVASGSSVVTIDLRTMQKVAMAAASQSKVCSFQVMPSESLICTGEIGKAMLWDLRKSQGTLKPDPVAELDSLDGQMGPVTFLHIDSYKIVTGGPEDPYVRIWDARTHQQTKSQCCSPLSSTFPSGGCSAMAVDKFRIVTATSIGGVGFLCYNDYSNASIPIPTDGDKLVSKFWEGHSDGEMDVSL